MIFFAVGKYFYLVSLKDIMKVLDRTNSCDKDEEMMACILHGNVQNTTNYLRSKLSRIHEKTIHRYLVGLLLLNLLLRKFICRENPGVSHSNKVAISNPKFHYKKTHTHTHTHAELLTILWALATTYQLPTAQRFSLLFRLSEAMRWKLFIC